MGSHGAKETGLTKAKPKIHKDLYMALPGLEPGRDGL